MEFGLQYGKWDVECGTWTIQYGARCKDCRIWRAWGMQYEEWSTVRIKECDMEYGGRRMKHGLQSMASGVWSAAWRNEKWSLEYGIRNMEQYGIRIIERGV